MPEIIYGMEASAAAAKLIDDYRGRKKRFGSQKATPGPIESKKRRLGPLLLLLPLLLVPSLFLLPGGASEGFAVLDGRPLADAEIVFVREDGNKYLVSTDGDGEFVARIPKGTYSAHLGCPEGDVVGPKDMKMHPGRSYRVSFSRPPLNDPRLTSGDQ